MEPVLVSVGNNFKIWDTDGYSQLYGVGISPHRKGFIVGMAIRRFLGSDSNSYKILFKKRISPWIADS